MLRRVASQVVLYDVLQDVLTQQTVDHALLAPEARLIGGQHGLTSGPTDGQLLASAVLGPQAIERPFPLPLDEGPTVVQQVRRLLEIGGKAGRVQGHQRGQKPGVAQADFEFGDEAGGILGIHSGHTPEGLSVLPSR